MKTLTIKAFGAEVVAKGISVRTADAMLPNAIADVVEAASGLPNELVMEFNVFDTTSDLLRESIVNECKRADYFGELHNYGATEFFGLRITWTD